MNSTGDTAVSLAPPSEEFFPCDLTEPNALEFDRGSDFSYTDSALTYGLGEDWVLFPDFMGLCEQDEDLVVIGPHPCDTVHALSFSGASDKWMQNIEKHVQRSSIERRSETRNGKIKRPLNAFILYRMAFRDVAEQLYATKDQKRVSKICGESWLQETKELRAWFRLQALTEKENCRKAWEVSEGLLCLESATTG
ncbi:HMG box domain-containing protein [Fusarium sp. LHS14.1]|nr:HMG box domain-containing protein [Fusarium sp. LHS14.1]